MKRLALAIILLASACVHPAPTPPQPPTVRRWTLTLISEPAGATITAVDGPKRDLCVTPCSVTLDEQGFTARAHKDGFVDPPWQGITLTANMTASFTLAAVPTALPPLHTDGPIFRLPDGTAWRYEAASAFALLDRYARGEDISDTLSMRPGGRRFNTLRVWNYVPVADWHEATWDVRPVATVRAFLERVAQDGYRVELTLLTDDNPARLAWAKAFVPQLTAGGCPTNLFLEAGNEPQTHKHIDTAALRPVLEASGCLHASGDYEDSARAYGSYLVAHTRRDDQWVRRGHDCFEYFHGHGPNAPTDPAHPVPCVLDEPPKPADVGGNQVKDWRGYFGTAGQLAAGATWHSESGKAGRPPTAAELPLAIAALEGLEAFPADAPLGAYHCLTCPGGSGDNTLRTYVVGKTMVRLRPATAAPPLAGWTSLDPDHILWRHQ